MNEKPLILLSNDDGIYSPGIKHLWKAVKDMGNIFIVAPAEEQSAVSLSITIRSPLSIEKIEWVVQHTEAWSVKGTPADCIKLALNVILPRKPLLILSGINRGTNAGRNILYSGTVAAAMEGVMHGIPSIAFSACDNFDPAYSEIEKYIQNTVNYLLMHPLPKETLLNVNFPKKSEGPIKGLKFARQGRELWVEHLEKREHPAERKPYYWLGAQLAQFDEYPESDVQLLREGYATAVPIHIGNLTDEEYYKYGKANFESIVNQFSSVNPK